MEKEMGIPDHLTYLLRNLDGGQEATVRTGHGTTDWFQIGKEGHRGCILSPCLFNFYVEYIMRNAGLEEAQAGIKIAGRNINNLRYADDTGALEGFFVLRTISATLRCMNCSCAFSVGKYLHKRKISTGTFEATWAYGPFSVLCA